MFGHRCKWLIVDLIQSWGEAEKIECTAALLMLLRWGFRAEHQVFKAFESLFTWLTDRSIAGVELQNFASSANTKVLLKVKEQGRLLMYTKRKGPKMLPLGMPVLTGNMSKG